MDLLKIGKSGSFFIVFFSKSDNCAYITGFNRGVHINFPEVYNMNVATLHTMHGKGVWGQVLPRKLKNRAIWCVLVDIFD